MAFKFTYAAPLALAAMPASAQTPPVPTAQSLPSQSDISRARVTLPPPEASNFDLRIQAPDKSPVPKAVDSIEFTLHRIDVEGATAFPPDQVNAYFTPLIDKAIKLEDVREAAAKLEQLYRSHGYFLSRVFVPPQKLEGDTLRIRVVEGYIADIYVEGMDAGTQRAVRKMLAPISGKKPIDLASVERVLLTLNDLPGIAGTSVLKQGSELGASNMVVTLAKPKDLLVANINNTNSRILGPWVYSLNANLNRPFDVPGAFNIGVSASGPQLKASQSLSARYSVKIGNDGLIASIGAIVAKARPAASLRLLDIRNNLVSVSARARYPLLRGRANSVFVEAGLSLNRSKTDILGQELVDDRTTVADAGLIYQQEGWADGSTTLNLNVYRGLQILGANDRSAPNPSVLDADPTFTRFTYTFQRIQSLPYRFSVLSSVQGQYTTSRLLSGELVSFGGPAIGRGYDPSTITGDRGLGGLVELRYDMSFGKPWLVAAQLYTFFDGARATSLATATSAKITDRLRSAGLGARLYEKFGLVDFQLAKAHRTFGGVDERPDPRALVSATFLY